MKIFLSLLCLFSCLLAFGHSSGQVYGHQEHQVPMATADEEALSIMLSVEANNVSVDQAPSIDKKDTDNHQSTSLLPNWVYLLILIVGVIAVLFLLNFRLKKVIVNASGPLLGICSILAFTIS